MSSPQRYPTNDELDYERRKAAGFPGLGVPGNQSKGEVTELKTAFAVEGNDTSAYIGVTQDRMTYANSTEQPLAAEDGTEKDREHRLLDQQVLVVPRPAQPEVKQTGGGGSSQEPVYTALSGESFSAEIAKPPTTEKVDATETTAGPADDSGQVEVGVEGGSTGEKVEEAQKDTNVAAAAASPAPSSLSGEGEDTESTGEEKEPVRTPAPAKKAATTPKQNS